MRRFGLSMLAVAVALGINLMAANEKPSDAMKAVMNANAAANTSARAAAKAMDYATLVNDAGTYRANLAYIDAFIVAQEDGRRSDDRQERDEGGDGPRGRGDGKGPGGGRRGSHGRDWHLRSLPQAVP